MMTFQQQYEFVQKMAQDYSAAALIFFKSQINQGKTNVESELNSFYTENTRVENTEAGRSLYESPDTLAAPKMIYVTVGGRNYIPEVVFDELLWQRIKAGYPTSTSDIMQKVIFRRDTFEVWPTPASSDNPITMIFEESDKELSADDYSGGVILTATNGAKAVVGSGTSWTSAMIGRFLKITSYKQEYEIAAVADATHLTLKKSYQGTSIAAGTEAYIIGEAMRTPETTHVIPCYYALWQYFLGFKQNSEKRAQWEAAHDKAFNVAKARYGRRTTDKYIPPQRVQMRQAMMINPNNYPGVIT